MEIVVIDAKGSMTSQVVMRAKTFGLSSHRPHSIGYQDPRKSSKNIDSFALQNRIFKKIFMVLRA